MELNDLMARLYRYELPAAIICILTPFILTVFNGSALTSISAYAYSDIAYLYVFLVTIASTLIVSIGAKHNEQITWTSGLALMVTPLTPYMTFPITHTLGSSLFFIGMIISMYSYSKIHKYLKLLITSVTALAFIGYLISNKITLFDAEALSLMAIGVYLIARIITDKKQYENE